jgi:TonB family protein
MLHHPHRSSLLRLFFLALVFIFPFVASPQGLAQNKTEQADQSLDDLQIRPIYATVRVFQMKARRGSYKDISSQAFRMKTASLSEYENWMSALGKTYPGFDIALIRTESKRVFRTSKPALISFGKQPDKREVEIMIYGAQSVGDGVTPGTTIVPEIGLHFGNDKVIRPITYAIQPLEVESGMTYFFTAVSMKMSSTDYVTFVRDNAPVEQFDGNDIYLAFAFSVDLDKTAQPARFYNEQQSVEIQKNAMKQVQPEVSAALREAGFGGLIRVLVEISPEGKVTSANIHNSTFPELNGEAIAAARRWEFPASLFAEDKNPITGFLTFKFDRQVPAQKTATQNSGKK